VNYYTDAYETSPYTIGLKGGAIMASKQQLVSRRPSRVILAAKKAGIDINLPNPHLQVIEQEQADIG
jgi:hypothetical protein